MLRVIAVLILVPRLVSLSVAAQNELSSSDEGLERIFCLMYEIRQAGRCGDATKIEWLLQTLQSPPIGGFGVTKVNFGFTATAKYHVRTACLVALARISSIESLPKLHQLQNDPEYALLSYMKPTIARIQADHLFPYPKTAAEWQAKMQVFLRISEIEAHHLAAYTSRPSTMYESHFPPSKETVCLRYLSEMAADAYNQGYQLAFEDLAQLGIQLGYDPLSHLIKQVTVLGKEKSVAWLTQQVLSPLPITDQSKYLVQALSDTGEKGLQAILQRFNSEIDTTNDGTELIVIRGVMALTGMQNPNAKEAIGNLISKYKEYETKHERYLLYYRKCPIVFVSDY